MTRIALNCLFVCVLLIFSNSAELAVDGSQTPAVDESQILPAAKKLAELLQSTNQFTTTFSQQTTNAYGEILEELDGRVILAKPNFSWQITHPYEQTIVANGEEIKVYDPDLQQLTVRSADSASASEIPLKLLTLAEPLLAEDFIVEQLYVEDEQTLEFKLYPQAADALFASINLTFQQGLLRRLMLVDTQGGGADIRFAHYSLEQVIQSDAFEIELPPDVDVVNG